jgi:putative DNA primase/helicase
VVYDPEAKCQLWEAEMKRAHGDDDDDPFADGMVDFIQRVCGYCLTGETYMKHFFFIYGPSGTGKSQIVAVLDQILGDWAGTVAPEKLMRRRQEGEIPEHWAGVRHCRMVQVPEVKSGDTLDEGLIQRLTGGDKVTARFMRENTFEYRPVSKFLMTGNYQPNVVTQNEAMWGRMMVIPYMKVIDEKVRIGDYWKVVLKDELPGILAWMVRGAVKFYEDGYRRPDEVKDLIREYRDEQDVVGTFIRSRCVLLPEAKSGPYELYEAFREFQGKRGEFKWPLKTFSQAMAEQEDRLKKLRRDKGEGPIFEKRRSGSSGARIYHGIALKPAAMMDDEVEA